MGKNILIGLLASAGMIAMASAGAQPSGINTASAQVICSFNGSDSYLVDATASINVDGTPTLYDAHTILETNDAWVAAATANTTNTQSIPPNTHNLLKYKIPCVAAVAEVQRYVLMGEYVGEFGLNYNGPMFTFANPVMTVLNGGRTSYQWTGVQYYYY